MYRVYLSPIAEKKLTILLEYLDTEWSREVRDNFLEVLKESFNKVSRFPNSCPVSELFPGLHKCVLTDQTSYFYRIKNDDIEIITITDNRQNPQIIQKEIRKLLQNP